MGQSFSLVKNARSERDPASERKRRIAVTGAAGNIGSYFAEHASDRHDLKLLVHRLDEDADKLKKFGQVVPVDLASISQLGNHIRDCDSVLHLAGAASPDSKWATVLENNIIGTYNLFVAAHAVGCPQVVYASSIHAVSGYPADVQVKTSDPVNPGDIYGVSKCFGEAMARYMAEQEGMRCIVVRIGAFQPDEVSRKSGSIGMADAWVSQRDLQQLLEKCLEADDIRFAIVHGLSDNRFKRLDISETRDLVGYEPQDDLTEINVALKNLEFSKKVKSHSLSDPGVKSGIREDLEEAKRTGAPEA